MDVLQLALGLAGFVAGCAAQPGARLLDAPPPVRRATMTSQPAQPTVARTDEEWRARLTPEQYRVLRQSGTERAFTGKYWNHKDDGTYTCAGCGQELFRSTTKFDSGCGWPSFYDAAAQGNIETREDNSLGMRRTEVVCKRCGGHLGHVFDDGPNPTGLRYCINSASLSFVKEPARK